MKKLLYLACATALLGAGCLQAAPEAENQDAQEEMMDALEETRDGMDEVLGEPALDLFIENPEMDEEATDDEQGAEDKNSETNAEQSEATNDQSEAPQSKTVSMATGNYFFDPASIRAEAGQEVTVTFAQNEGVHKFVIDEIGLDVPINEGASITFTAPEEPGTYSFYCSIGNHRALGMEGVLIVK